MYSMKWFWSAVRVLPEVADDEVVEVHRRYGEVRLRRGAMPSFRMSVYRV